MPSHWRKSADQIVHEHRNKLALYQRTQELIDFMMDCNGYTTLSKRQIAEKMAEKYGRAWRTVKGDPDRGLVGEACNVTRDQDIDPIAKGISAGYYCISYAPNTGGLVLVDANGHMRLDQQLHMLSGDMQEQQKAKTIMRRRISSWKEAAISAMNAGDFELGRTLSQAENEIITTGFISDTLVAALFKMFTSFGVGPEAE